jgi:hypothetical protein
MFVVDHTPAGFPIGVFEDDMDHDWNDDPGTRTCTYPVCTMDT